ncbi:hypothetical protein CAP39_06970 [Sphingomonas sp. IBVSS1]|nr:hypothetical protein CAP39_06970 [Sphingomonas sp. IBVSS1]
MGNSPMAANTLIGYRMFHGLVGRNGLRSLPMIVCALAGLSAAQAQQQQSQTDTRASLAGASDPSASAANAGAQQNPFIGNQPLRASSIEDASQRTITLQQLLAARAGEAGNSEERLPALEPARPGEFELLMERLLGRKLRRFGDTLLLPGGRDFATPATATVPADYVIQPGDKIELGLTGSLNGTTTLDVDTNGRVFITEVGAVRVAGFRNAELRDRLAQAIGSRFRNFTVNVVVRELRGIRVYVTGFAARPGSFTLSGLSTVANAVLQAGGPAAGGSFRSIKVYRNSREIGSFDLYDLLRGGRRITDVNLQNEDVLFIPPAGPQVAVIGSVQDEAIYELRQGETLADAVKVAGGPNTLADASQLVLYRSGKPEQAGPQMIPLAGAAGVAAEAGDIVQMLSQGSLIQPTNQQSMLVRVEGEVARPGNYYLPAGSRLADVLQKAGGLTDRAYPFAARFTRQMVKVQQQANYEEALRQLELTIASAPLAQQIGLNEGDRDGQLRSAAATLARLREVKPDGRVVLDVAPGAMALPDDIVLENNDAVVIPPRTSVVGVFGAVHRPTSFFLQPGRKLRIRDLLENAGGAVRSADRANTIVIRANGQVLSRRLNALDAQALPGDVVFVPVRTQGSLFWARFKDISTTLFGLGITAATLVAVTR